MITLIVKKTMLSCCEVVLPSGKVDVIKKETVEYIQALETELYQLRQKQVQDALHVLGKENSFVDQVVTP